MKNIIAFSGRANTGKTTTIKAIYLLIKRNYPNATIEEFVVAVDIKIVITIRNIKIGIESQGDPNSRLFASLTYFVKIDCDIILCATRTRGATVNAVTNLQNKYQIFWANSNFSPNVPEQQSNNTVSAKALFKQIRKLIDA